MPDGGTGNGTKNLAARRVVTSSDTKRLTYAASRLLRPLLDVGRREPSVKTAVEWQIDAWDLFDRLGVIKYPVQQKARVASKCRLFAATRPDLAAPPVPVDDDDSDVPADIAAAAQAQMERFRGPIGGTAELLRCAYVNIDIPGEFYLLGQDAQQANAADGQVETLPESWQIRSIEELNVNLRDGWYKFVGSAAQKPLSEVSLNRVWTPHPRRFELADSPMRALIEDGETLLAFKRLFRASAKSRLPAGLGLLPDSLTFGAPDPTRNGVGDGEAPDDPFDQDLLDAIFRAVEEEGAPSSLAPIWLRGPADELDKAKVLDFGRKVTKEDLDIVKAAIDWIAIGLDTPAEFVTGMADVNHWTGWLLDEQSFRNHLEPTMVALCEAFTVVFMQAELVKQGFDPAAVAKVMVWYDESEAVINTEAGKQALELRKVHAVSDAYLRKASHVGEDAAPDDAELARQIANDAKGRVLLDPSIEGVGVIPQVPGAQQSESPVGGPTATTRGPAQTPLPVVAAVAASPVAARELSRLDHDLRIWLEAATTAAMHRALERAGTQARNHSAEFRVRAQGVPAELVLAHLGPRALEEANLQMAGLLAGAFSHLRDEWRRRVAHTQAAAYRHAAAYAPRPIRTPDDVQLGDWSNTGWQHLEHGLEQSLSESLGAPNRQPNISRLVREALSLAGGAAIAVAGLGVAAGRGVIASLRDAGTQVAGYQWEWAPGDLGGVFEPHEMLNGTESESEDGIEFGGYQPGDVDGCNCDLVVTVLSAAADEGDTEAATVEE